MIADGVIIRAAQVADIPPLTKLWFDGWQDAHAEILPPEVARQRTYETFRTRLECGLGQVRVACRTAEPVGMAWIADDELYQFYVHASVRGTGLADLLMADAKQQFADRGTETAWLACAIGNDRAARFYKRCGWRNAGVMANLLHLPEGEYSLQTWRFELPINR